MTLKDMLEYALNDLSSRNTKGLSFIINDLASTNKRYGYGEKMDTPMTRGGLKSDFCEGLQKSSRMNA